MMAKRKNKDNMLKRFRSLSVRTIGAIAVSCIFLGIIATLIGLMMYNRTLSTEYIRHAFSIASYASISVTHGVDYISYSKQIMDIYHSLTPEQRNMMDRPQYAEFFADVDMTDEGTYTQVMYILSRFISKADVADVYLAMYDEATGALVYMADPESEYQFMPGEWELVSKTEIDKFLHWDGEGMLYDTSDTYRYGWMCTAGVPLYDNEGNICAFVLSDIRTNNIHTSMFSFALQVTIALLIITVLITWTLTKFMKSTVVNPIKKLTSAASGYVKDKKAGESTTHRFENLKIDSSTELEELTHAMKEMEKSISENEEYRIKVNAEKQRIATELGMASKIQTSMLPSTFPAFPDRTEFDIFASMTPAREVGGDFYDFFLIDDDHICLVMADVSGKGIPAALFMMISKVIVQSCAMLGKSASEILTKTNEALCSNNKTEMFVTVWVGVFEISTGKLTASNAGHEYPALYQDGKFSLLQDKHSLFIAGMPNTKYTEYTVQLKPGDKLFLYTDGVTEATNAKQKLFGTDRLVEALNIDPTQNPEGILNTVRGEVDKFVGKAEQFDDITMMCFEYKGKSS